MADPSRPPPLFVVGSGRCGSTLLSRMLDLHPELIAIPEFLVGLSPRTFPAGDLDGATLWEILSEPRPKPKLMYRQGLIVPEFLYRPRPGSRFDAATGVPPICLAALPHLGDADALFDRVEELALSFPPAPAGEQYARLFEWWAERAGKPRWAERSGSSLRFLAKIDAAFPDARFVHIHRDGPDCAISMSNHHAFRLGAIAATIRSHLGVDPFRTWRRPDRPLPAPLAALLPEAFDLGVYLEYEIPLAQFGAMWSAQLVGAAPTLARLGDRILSVAYEQLLAAPGRELARIARFADLDLGSGWLAAAAALVGTPRSSVGRLPAAEAAELARACALGTRVRGRTGGAKGAVAAA